MKPAPFDYVRPESLDDALAALAGDPGAKVLAGGQSLVPLLSMRLAAPSRLVDINGLPGLDSIEARPDGVRIGALGAARRRAGVRRRTARAAAGQPGAGQRRPRRPSATAGPPSARSCTPTRPPRCRWCCVCWAVRSRWPVRPGRRTIEAADLYVGPLESSLHHDEIAVSAFFPALPEGAGVAFEEIARRHGDYALCGVAALVTDETVKAGYLSVCEVPTVVDLTGVADADLGDAALEHLDPGDDIHASADYRAQLVRVLTARVVAAARKMAQMRAAQ